MVDLTGARMPMEDVRIPADGLMGCPQCGIAIEAVWVRGIKGVVGENATAVTVTFEHTGGYRLEPCGHPVPLKPLAPTTGIIAELPDPEGVK